MKLLGMLAGAVLFLLVGGMIYLGVADIAVPQTTVTKDVQVGGQ